MLLLYPFFFIFPVMMQVRGECSKQSYEECIRIADPLIREPRLIFPDKLEDIDIVCQTWNKLVDCLKFYTDNCLTAEQRRQFNEAVENPIESVHQLCTQPVYQQEYLQYATCIKNTITQNTHCGSQYTLLVDQAAQGATISKSTMCCSHDRFKQCVLRETKRCDRSIADGLASKFAEHIIDKALSFLQDQCFNYIPNTGDCTSLTTDYQSYSDPLTISSTSSEVHPWSTIQEVAVKEIQPSRVAPSTRMSTTTQWLPSSSIPIEPSDSSPTQMLGTRSRPASFARAGWSDTPSPAGNTIQMYPEAATSQSSRPDWATAAYWTPNEQPEEHKQTTKWYPVRGSSGNDVDEPNQQSLTNNRNSVGQMRSLRALLVFAVVIVICG